MNLSLSPSETAWLARQTGQTGMRSRVPCSILGAGKITCLCEEGGLTSHSGGQWPSKQLSWMPLCSEPGEHRGMLVLPASQKSVAPIDNAPERERRGIEPPLRWVTIST